MSNRPHVTIYTDGACSGNPGAGGYGLVLLHGSRRMELSGGFRNTTNNRMELLGVITALGTLKRPCVVTLYSDSQYVVNAVTKRWLNNWMARNWRKPDNKPVLNADLWKRLIPLLEHHRVRFEWVRGHSSNVENERCDILAVAASQSPDLPPDTEYEAGLLIPVSPAGLTAG